jgi:hypothetical protein
MPLKYYLRVTTHPTSRALPTFRRSSKHDKEFQAAEAPNINPLAMEHTVQTLSKFDDARISLTSAWPY